MKGIIKATKWTVTLGIIFLSILYYLYYHFVKFGFLLGVFYMFCEFVTGSGLLMAMFMLFSYVWGKRKHPIADASKDD